MRWLANQLKTNLLVVAISLAIVGAFVAPGCGRWLKTIGAAEPMIFLIFLCQGLAVKSKDFQNVRSFVGLLVAGGVVAHVLAPVLAWATVNLLGWEGDQRVGFVLICCMAPTLVSGVVIAVQAGGQRASALVLTVGLNLAAILTIPFNLRWTLGTSAQINRGELLAKLVFLILVPAVLGQLAGRRWPERTARHTGLIKLLPVILLGLTVYMSVSDKVGRLSALGWRDALGMIAAALAVHYLLLASGYGGARWGLRAPESRCRALAIVCSQKTIPVAVAVWAMVFESRYPLAIIPAIVFHLSQIYADGLLARWWSRHPVEGEAA